jgi:hypothetical protein
VLQLETAPYSSRKRCGSLLDLWLDHPVSMDAGSPTLPPGEGFARFNQAVDGRPEDSAQGRVVRFNVTPGSVLARIPISVVENEGATTRRAAYYVLLAIAVGYIL